VCACVRARARDETCAGRRRQVCRTLRRRRRLLSLPHYLKVHTPETHARRDTRTHARTQAPTHTHARTERRTHAHRDACTYTRTHARTHAHSRAHRYYCGLCSKTRPSAAHFEGRPYNADHAAGASLCACAWVFACVCALVRVGVCVFVQWCVRVAARCACVCARALAPCLCAHVIRGRRRAGRHGGRREARPLLQEARARSR
jgi:hypothetical protein